MYLVTSNRRQTLTVLSSWLHCTTRIIDILLLYTYVSLYYILQRWVSSDSAFVSYFPPIGRGMRQRHFSISTFHHIDHNTLKKMRMYDVCLCTLYSIHSSARNLCILTRGEKIFFLFLCSLFLHKSLRVYSYRWLVPYCLIFLCFLFYFFM